MFRQLAIFGILFVALVGGFFVFQIVPKAVQHNKITVLIADKVNFYVQIADTPILRTRGLSSRKSLGEKEGLFFIFEQPDFYGFWMKDMLFPIDIVWINDGVVAGVTSNLQPDDSPNRAVYYPPVAANRVLEIPAGSAEKFSIAKGDQVIISNNKY